MSGFHTEGLRCLCAQTRLRFYISLGSEQLEYCCRGPTNVDHHYCIMEMLYLAKYVRYFVFYKAVGDTFKIEKSQKYTYLDQIKFIKKGPFKYYLFFKVCYKVLVIKTYQTIHHQDVM